MSFLRTVKELDGKVMQGKRLLPDLSHNAFKSFRAPYLANGMDNFLSESWLNQPLSSEEEVSFSRARYNEFMEKSLSRVIQLPTIRNCHEHPRQLNESNPTGMHIHEKLVFWSAKVCIEDFD